MGIYKAADKIGKYPKALEGLLKYAFGEGDKKTYIENVIILGEYNQQKIDADSVYKQFQDTKEFWNNTGGRQYFHGIHSFHADEKITEEQAAELTAQLCEVIFPNHQAVIVPHHDKDGIDVHIIVNSVSYLDGKKVHTSKKDLERHKEICNEICLQNGFSVPEKGKDFYGNDLNPDTVISWKKDTFQQLKKADPSHKAAETNIDMFKLVLLIIQALLRSRSIADFIEYMKRNSWKVTWTENRKHITFESTKTNRKFRTSNIDKTYGAKLRYVFGQDFILDKDHMKKMCETDLEHKTKLYGTRADKITNEVKVGIKDFPKEQEQPKDPQGTWIPAKEQKKPSEDKTPPKKKEKQKSKSKEWTPPGF